MGGRVCGPARGPNGRQHTEPGAMQAPGHKHRKGMGTPPPNLSRAYKGNYKVKQVGGVVCGR